MLMLRFLDIGIHLPWTERFLLVTPYLSRPFRALHKWSRERLTSRLARGTTTLDLYYYLVRCRFLSRALLFHQYQAAPLSHFHRPPFGFSGS